VPKEVILSPSAPAPVGPYSQAVKVGPLIFVSGQIPLDNTGSKVGGGAGKETERCLENMKAVLQQAGVGLEQVVKVTVFMTDLADFKFMNQVYEKYFPLNPPARSTVQVAKLPKDAHVEIEAIAILGA
jgi:2-iminobutanoate/2-iminopropanoate deaminase